MTEVYHRTPSAPMHNGVIGPGYWTVVATRFGAIWRYRDGFESKHLIAASATNEIIVMHRRSAEGWQLVAQLAGPAWRRLQERSAR